MTSIETLLTELGIEAKLESTTETGAAMVYSLKLARVNQVKDLLRSKAELDIFFGKKVNLKYPVAPMTVSVEVAKEQAEQAIPKEITAIQIGRNEKQEIYFDLADNPHLLVGGTTGSGKSNFLHILISSLMARFSPQQLQFYMVDPKGTELSMYDNSEYVFDFIEGKNKVLSSDITPCQEVFNFLHILMKMRERAMQENKLRTFDEYQKQFPDEPRIVVIIDEFAELMSDQFEYDNKDRNFKEDTVRNILPILRMGRAFGIHVVAATQRPSVDIVPAQLKANMSRICFQVKSRVDSRVILDESGGENLPGKGAFCFKDSQGNVVFGQSHLMDQEAIQKILSKPQQGKYIISYKALDSIMTLAKNQQDNYCLYNPPFTAGLWPLLLSLSTYLYDIIELSVLRDMLAPYAQCKENVDSNIARLVNMAILKSDDKTQFRIEKKLLGKLLDSLKFALALHS